LLPISKVAEKIRQTLPEVEGKRRMLAIAAPTQVNPVSVLLVCAMARAAPGPVLYLSVDRPNETLSRLVNRHCAGGPSILFPNVLQDPPKAREVACVSGLFAPKLMLETFGQIANIKGGPPPTVIMGNLSTLIFYNSNDRIKEFITKLGEKVEDNTIGRLVMVMDRNALYIYSMAKQMCDTELDLSQ